VHVGRAHQVRRGQTQADAGIDQGQQPGALGRGRLEVEIGVEPVDRQPQRLQHQEGRLVAGVGGAVAVGQPGGAEPSHREPEDFTQGVERRFVGGSHAGLDYPT